MVKARQNVNVTTGCGRCCRVSTYVLVLNSTEETWENLASPYMESPFFTLDMEVVNIPVYGSRVEIGDDFDDQDLLDLPSPKHGPGSLKAAAVECRERLSLIQNATYICQKEDILKELSTKLEAASVFINSNLHVEDGLCLDVEENKKTIHTQHKSQPSIRCIKSRKKKSTRLNNIIIDKNMTEGKLGEYFYC